MDNGNHVPIASGSGETADLDGVRRRLALMEEFLAWRRLVDRSREGNVTSGAKDRGDEGDPVRSEESEQNSSPEVEWMRRAQRALVSHPVATQSVFVSLVREGRAFAATDEGRAWSRLLQDAPAVQRLRTLWEAANLTLTTDEEKTPLPSAMIELFVRSAASGDVDELAARLGLPFLGSARARDVATADEDAE